MEPIAENGVDKNRSEPDSLGSGRMGEVHPVSVGNALREARERLGLSIADVANQIKFATRQIEALEADNFQQLKGVTFLRGFVRSYAKILHLDAQLLLEKLPVSQPMPQQLAPSAVETQFPSMLSTRRQNLIWSGSALALAVILVVFGLMHSPSPIETSSEKAKVEHVETPLPLPAEIKTLAELAAAPSGVEAVVSKPKGSPAPAQSATAQSAVPPEKNMAAKPVQITPPIPSIKPSSQPQVRTQSEAGDTATKTSTLRLVFSDESWTEITDKDGKILSSKVNQPGSELRLKGHPPFAMLIGRALSVRLFHDDEEIDLHPYINKYSEVAHITLE